MNADDSVCIESAFICVHRRPALFSHLLEVKAGDQLARSHTRYAITSICRGRNDGSVSAGIDAIDLSGLGQVGGCGGWLRQHEPVEDIRPFSPDLQRGPFRNPEIAADVEIFGGLPEPPEEP